MKTCIKCNIEKDFSQFHKRKNSYQSWCKLCRKEYDRLWHRNNYDRLKPLKNQWKRNYNNWFNKLKDQECTDCKVKYPYYVMQWDHKPGFIKSFTFGYVKSKRLSKNTILEEIKKCDLVCANCHAIRTYTRSHKLPH